MSTISTINAKTYEPTAARSVAFLGLGVMGLIIPAMLIRIAKGHTGRKVVFDRGDKAGLRRLADERARVYEGLEHADGAGRQTDGVGTA